MLFHAQSFVLAFLPMTVALYYALARHIAAREWVLIAASLVFYGWWDVRFLPLLIGHATLTWLLARGYDRTGWRWLLMLGVTANLMSLAVFKYTNFLVEIANDVTGLTLPTSDIILPIGISFFSFQCISYLIDLDRGEAPQYPFRRLSVFVMLFPQLIAGPIVRHHEIIPQLDRDPLRAGVAERLTRGITLFVIGLLLKVLVADKLARVVDPVFATAAGATPDLWSAWLAVVAFALQIYFDFSAYSEMAIGIALMLGLHFPLNFNMPYRAVSLRDFWRRWHMTLSRFLRDYLYIPLGGSRQGSGRLVLATMLTMGLCGLWHGAGWTFVIWGLLHGAGLIICRIWANAEFAMPSWLGWLLTVLFVALTFMIFRAPDLTTVAHMSSGLLAGGGIGVPPPLGVLVLVMIAAALSVLPRPNPEVVQRFVWPQPAAAAGTAVAAVYVMLEVGRGAPASFIYFQF